MESAGRHRIACASLAIAYTDTNIHVYKHTCLLYPLVPSVGRLRRFLGRRMHACFGVNHPSSVETGPVSTILGRRALAGRQLDEHCNVHSTYHSFPPHGEPPRSTAISRDVYSRNWATRTDSIRKEHGTRTCRLTNPHQAATNISFHAPTVLTLILGKHPRSAAGLHQLFSDQMHAQVAPDIPPIFHLCIS